MNQRQELIIAVVLILTAFASLLIVLTYYGPGSHQTLGICGAGAQVNISSTEYCALDITGELEFAGNGISRLANPVNYMGVTFSTVCQDNLTCGNIGCPPSTNGICTVSTMAILRFNLLFPDGSNETLSTFIGDEIPPPVLSIHQNPVAGFEVTGTYSSMKFFLLVQEPSGALYNVTFQQDGRCSPEFWVSPWSVTVGNQTKVQPEGTPLPLDDNIWASTEEQNLSAITFLLPDGSYPYQVHPSYGFGGLQNPDPLAVSGKDVVIHIGAEFGCTTTVAVTP